MKLTRIFTHRRPPKVRAADLCRPPSRSPTLPTGWRGTLLRELMTGKPPKG